MACLLLLLPVLVLSTHSLRAEERTACLDDAMLIFDASKSMAAADADAAGLRRIDSVRAALARVLPGIAPKRRLGLITYGPGDDDACTNVTLALRPQIDAAKKIQSAVNDLLPGGRTPLTRAVRMAADVLEFRRRPGTIVLLTDGEESCGGDPCALARAIKAEAAGLVVHVVSYRIKDSLGSDQVFQARCLAEETGGTSVDANTTSELVDALEKTLSCPLISKAPGAPAGTRLGKRALKSRSVASAR